MHNEKEFNTIVTETLWEILQREEDKQIAIEAAERALEGRRWERKINNVGYAFKKINVETFN